jgi:hypothetical protein
MGLALEFIERAVVFDHPNVSLKVVEGCLAGVVIFVVQTFGRVDANDLA